MRIRGVSDEQLRAVHDATMRVASALAALIRAVQATGKTWPVLAAMLAANQKPVPGRITRLLLLESASLGAEAFYDRMGSVMPLDLSKFSGDMDDEEPPEVELDLGR